MKYVYAKKKKEILEPGTIQQQQKQLIKFDVGGRKWKGFMF